MGCSSSVAIADAAVGQMYEESSTSVCSESVRAQGGSSDVRSSVHTIVPEVSRVREVTDGSSTSAVPVVVFPRPYEVSVSSSVASKDEPPTSNKEFFVAC